MHKKRLGSERPATHIAGAAGPAGSMRITPVSSEQNELTPQNWPRCSSLFRQRWQCFVIPIPGEVFSMPERNTEENLTLKGIPPSLKEPLQGDLRGCLRVLPLLFDDIYSAFRKQNIAKRVVGAIRRLPICTLRKPCWVHSPLLSPHSQG